MSTQDRFIHLRLHSAYSLLEGAIQVKKLPDMCADMGMPAVAVTDSGNLFGALEFSETAAKAGVQPIVGCQLDLAYATAANVGGKVPPPRAIVVLAQNEAGYLNLMELNSCASIWTADAMSCPRCRLAHALTQHSEGLICLTGGALGPVGQLVQDGQHEAAKVLLMRSGGYVRGPPVCGVAAAPP